MQALGILQDARAYQGLLQPRRLGAVANDPRGRPGVKPPPAPERQCAKKTGGQWPPSLAVQAHPLYRSVFSPAA